LKDLTGARQSINCGSLAKAFAKIVLLLLLLSAIWDAAAYTKVTVMAPAVAQTAQGWIGATSYITVFAEPGNGSIFVDTFPLTQIDTQGSARLAAQVAASLAGQNLAKIDLFVTIRSDSAVIGGPSAGGAMSVAILACLLNRTVNPKVVMTGTINPDGTIGPIGGVLQKAEAAHSVGAYLFLVPAGQTVATESPDSLTLVNVTEYARKNLNLTVMEVDDLRDAAKWMIGVEIKPTGGKEIDLSKYNDIMSKAAQDMLDSAAELSERAKKEFDSATLTFNQRNELRPYVDDCARKIENARQAQKAKTYYLSASYSFQSKINSTYVLYALEYLRSKSRETAKKIISEAEKSAAAAVEDVNRTSFTSITAFECYAAAQTRAHEALRAASTAWELYYAGSLENQILRALAQAAYVTQRAESALWWVGLCDQFPGDVEMDRAMLKSTAQGYVDDLKFLLAYAQSFGTTVSSGLLATASDLLDDVEDELNSGAYAAAILEALRARSYVNAHLELAASLASTSEEKLASALSDKVKKEREQARSAIASSRDFGVNPILALSHLESGENDADKVDASSPASARIDRLMQAYLELKYARLVAEMSPVISSRLGISPEKNPPEILPFTGTIRTVYKTKAADAILIAGASAAGGLVVGTLLGRRGAKKSRHAI